MDEDDPNSSPTRELEETTSASPYHVAEHHPWSNKIWEPITSHWMKQSTWIRTVEADAYVWCYALLVVHARKEEVS